MKQKSTDPGSRRRFLSLGLLSGAGLLTQKVEAMTALPEEEESVSMLTADGKLVQVSKKVLEQTQEVRKDKTRNEDILNWTDSLYKPKK
ncbi:MAG: hypothetical protein KBA14_03045 [Saprospiraceae bacterium]|nr:hypothetical protein [Saprospiraceae bacterium]